MPSSPDGGTSLDAPCELPLRLCAQPPASSGRVSGGSTQSAVGPRLVGVACLGPGRSAIIAASISKPVQARGRARFDIGFFCGGVRLPSSGWLGQRCRRCEIGRATTLGVAGVPRADMSRWVLLQRGRCDGSERSSTHSALCSCQWPACVRTKQHVQRAGHGTGPSRGGVVRMPAPSPPDPIARGALPSKLASKAMLGQPRGSSSTCR